MVKIVLLSSIDPKLKAGYFNAVNDRVLEFKSRKDLCIKSYSLYKSGALFKFSIKRDSEHYYIEYPKILPSRGIFSFILLGLLRLIIFFIIVVEKPSIIHAHWGYPIAYAGVFFKRFFKNIKFIVTFHGSDVHTYPMKYKDIFKKTSEICSQADYVTAVSRELVIELKKQFNVTLDKISVTYNGIKLDNSDNTLVSKEVQRFSFIGNLNDVKGADRIIPLFKALSEKLQDEFEFIVAGSGPRLDELKIFASTVKTGNFKVVGPLPRAQALALMKASSCIFILSRKEGLGISAIEGLLYSDLCIALDVGGLPEVFVTNENLLIKGDFDSLLIVNKYIELKQNCYKVNRAYVMDNFSIDKNVENECALYHKILE